MQEREKEDQWTVQSNEYGYIYTRVNGQVIFGDGLRLTLNGKTDGCENAVLGTSWYIGPDPSNLANDLEDTSITLEAFGGEIEAWVMLVMEYGKGEKVAFVNIMRTDTAEMAEFLDVMNQEYDTVEMAIKPTKSFRADKIFPSLSNSWSLSGSQEAFGKARELCERMVEDTIT
ncbi:MAG: hypothetical protein VX690_04495 [Pseudomonadota bacterium]|nr:hypothetical protein [Pseudomonadota bacterium]